MSSFLTALPHQIPFRAISGARIIDDATIEGVVLCSEADALRGARRELMLVEAMAQAAGMLAFGDSPTPGMLVRVDELRCSSPPRTGDRVDVRVEMEASFGGIFRFHGSGRIGGQEIATARFHLASGPETSSDPTLDA
ncbi:MAG TPA: hypothetical protein VM534_03790 [Thermoanaerobaculia bacterium]|nr:hypothetical protein [Thermoanaerobaculia bacterium]